jgi:hypothetical protein
MKTGHVKVGKYNSYKSLATVSLIRKCRGNAIVTVGNTISNRTVGKTIP